jgi:hypothetical protein
LCPSGRMRFSRLANELLMGFSGQIPACDTKVFQPSFLHADSGQS